MRINDILHAGLLTSLFRDMVNTEDVLACLAALQQVTELATMHSVPPTIAEQALAQLRRLLHPQQDFALLCAALQASANILRVASVSAADDFIKLVDNLLEVR